MHRWSLSGCDGYDKYQVCIILSFGYLFWSFTSVSFVSLLDWDKGFRIFSPGSHHVEDKGATPVFKEFTQSSQNCMGHNDILRKLFMRPCRMFSRKQYHSIVSRSFHLLFPLSENLKNRKELQQSVFHFLSNCLHRCHPYNMVPRAHTRAKNVRARTGKRPKLIIHHLHISLPRPWPRSFYPKYLVNLPIYNI